MPSLTTCLTWQEVQPRMQHGAVVAVIDVLRWSTVVVTALANGAERVECFATSDEAIRRADAIGRRRLLLGGERDNVRIPGFDLGNSPAEYSRERVAGQVVLSTTTNGTQALRASRNGASQLVAAFVNLEAAAVCLAEAFHHGRDILLVAAGQAGTPAPEDTACAGALAERIGVSAAWSGATAAAIAVWRGFDCSAVNAVMESPHAQSLRESGFGADLGVAAAISTVELVPWGRPDGSVHVSDGRTTG